MAGSIAPGDHNATAIFTPIDSVDFTGSINKVPLTIVKEDANVTYTGQYVLYTSSPSTYSATAPLTFTVQESNAVPNTLAIYDLNPGDIRNARYKILVDGVATSECSNLQPSLVTADTRVGTIGCIYTFSFSSSQTGIAPTITVSPDTNSYYADSTGDTDFPMSINLPNQTNLITGGGLLVNSASAGAYAGDPGVKTNFGFNVKYNKGGTNLQGNANIIVRRSGRL
ncbi:hypothetical protein [Edaphobacter aggregans]|uniref:hypothetical protein n=1 Tax=Edaphobacter aggregans TaxID=570835 RepID=UPI000557F3A8|nr:hypothetical protein [Edaphobacter aggregans]